MPQTLQHNGKWSYDPLAASYKIGRSGLLASDIRNLRYPGTCVNCGSALPARTPAHWNPESKVITCLACAEHLFHTDAVAESDPEPAIEPHSLTSIEPESGTPGDSALYEFERRHKKREAAIDKRFGRWSGVVKFLVDDPQSTRAWEKGSEGERRLAEDLSRRLGKNAVLLHDRRIPGSKANIDHLAIASSGVWAIDAKKYSGQLKRINKRAWFRTNYRVYVNGRDQTKLVPGLHRQASVVLDTLGDAEVPVHQALCFVDAEWGLFSKPFQIDGVWITYSKHLAGIIAEPGPFSKDDVLTIANLLARTLRPAIEPQ